MKNLVRIASLLLLVATFLALGSTAAIAQTLYNNGAPNGNDAWTINFGYWVEDSFTLASASTVTGINFAAWLYPGDIVQSVKWTIFSAGAGAGPGGLIMRSGTATVLTSGLSCGTGCLEEAFFPPGVQLPVGTYYLRLEKAVVTNGDPAYWAESGGASKAYQNTVGSIPSESSQVFGTQ